MSDQPPVRRPTPDEVLHALRHFAQFNSDEPFMWPLVEPIVAATTLKKFDFLRDSDGDLGYALNDFFGLAIPDADWAMVLARPRQTTVGELCEFLAARVALTPLAAFNVLDRRCEPGSVFVTLKAALAASGVNVRDLVPSTPIARYAWDYPTYCTLVKTAARIAPARLPLSEFAVGGQLLAVGRSCGCVAILVFVFLSTRCADALGDAVFVAMLVAWVVLFVAVFAYAHESGWNRMPGVRTFRDLCKVLAGEPAERPARTKGSAP